MLVINDIGPSTIKSVRLTPATVTVHLNNGTIVVYDKRKS
jgi:hypothetical protein